MEAALHIPSRRIGLLDRLLLALRALAGGLASRRGDSTAEARADARCRQLLDAHGNAVLRLAYTYVHNTADAEDVLQETMIQYLRAQPELVNERHERAWLLRVAANLAKNRIAANTRRSVDELDEELVAEDRPDLAFVWEAVRELPEAYREVVHLYYEEGYTTPEIANLLGEPAATVRSRLARAREQLRDVLKEAYDFE